MTGCAMSDEEKDRIVAMVALLTDEVRRMAGLPPTPRPEPADLWLPAADRELMKRSA